MIKVYANNNFLYSNKKKYKCALGVNGIKKNKLEGDGCTPSGQFKVKKLYYRQDRVKITKSNIKPLPIKKNMYWCDDPDSIHYNKLILHKEKSYEKLYRADNLYNIILVINYNTDPVIKHKGSAIFIHLAKRNYAPTKGCIALDLADLVEIIGHISINEKIQVIAS